MIVKKSNFKAVLAFVERKDTVTARKVEKALKKHAREILSGVGRLHLTPQEEKTLFEDKEAARENPKKKKAPKRKTVKLNPLSARTKRLRDSGALKPHEWIGGNDFFRVHPKVDKFLERERHGQLRMELNPKKKDEKYFMFLGLPEDNKTYLDLDTGKRYLGKNIDKKNFYGKSFVEVKKNPKKERASKKKKPISKAAMKIKMAKVRAARGKK